MRKEVDEKFQEKIRLHNSSGSKLKPPRFEQIILDEQIKPYEIWFSTDPFQKLITVPIATTGTHETLGLQLRPAEHHIDYNLKTSRRVHLQQRFLNGEAP